ncbi:MAG: cupin domain-containing protein [Bdellovibrionota bacterium]
MRHLILLFFLVPTLAFAQTKWVVPQKDAPHYEILGGKGSARLYLNESTGSKIASLSTLTLFASAQVAEHVHEQSAEILYIESGHVEMKIGREKIKAGPGAAIYIPASVPHSARVLPGKGPVKAVQVYVGPGPEQRFTQGRKIGE